MSKTIIELQTGDRFAREMELVLMLTSVEKKVSKRGDYYAVTFQDKSGVISGNMWEIPAHLKSLKEDCEANGGLYVSVYGEVTSYQGKNQLNVKDLKTLLQNQVIVEDFIPVSKFDKRAMWESLKQLITQTEDEEYRSLLIAVFNDPETRDKFISAIAALKHHHNYASGLLEHSLQVTLAALKMTEVPFAPQILDRSLITAGGLLHDIGKINEYQYSAAFRMNPNGIEHRYGGLLIIDNIVRKYNVPISPEKLKKVQNIIMSHHGQFGDTNIRYESHEANLIHLADMVSAHILHHEEPLQ